MQNWYPDFFEDIKNFSPIKGDDIFVSELVTYKLEFGIKSTRDYQTLLVDSKLIESIKPNEINQATNSSVHPIYDKEFKYKGRSTVFVSRTKGLDKLKPFVISWESANNFSFQPDPYFLLTYGLSPRVTENHIYWDDLSRPKMEVVSLTPKSTYDFPNYSKSFVRINKDYLQDYADLKKKTIIQVYCETRILPIDDELVDLLDKNGNFERTTKFNHFRILKTLNNEIFSEVIGFRVLSLKNTTPISKRSRNNKSHKWPGFDKDITALNAKHREYVYVSDEVLKKYEHDSNYDVCPETRGVSYNNQWSVTRCYRIGRNHIGIELFKLYEGTPNEVISYWNKFAVDISTIETKKINISERSKKLVYAYLQFGEELSSLLNHYFDTNLTCEDLIHIDRKKLKYYGWYNNETIKPITNHLEHTLSKQSFLYRQKQLNLFLVENLVEKNFRAITKILGIDLENFKKNPNENFRSLKLLDFILNYCRISNETGLDMKNDSIEINSRLLKEYQSNSTTKLLTALNAMRQLDSHKTGNTSQAKLEKALLAFEIDKNEFTNNYLTACELIYDKLENSFKQILQLVKHIKATIY